MWQIGDFVHFRLQVWQTHHVLSILLHEGDERQSDDVVEHTIFAITQQQGREEWTNV
jgi:hypothetical protein